MTWTYRQRLRREGLVLAACGAAGSVMLLVAVEASRERPLSTVLQLAALAALLGVLGPRAVRRWAAAAPDLPSSRAGAGEPTPLWMLPVICAGLALAIGVPTGAWDAALRVTGGCLLVGLAQAVVLERVAAAEERRRGGTLVRVAGSRLIGGTKLAVVRPG
jgi:hypothetical protein